MMKPFKTKHLLLLVVNVLAAAVLSAYLLTRHSTPPILVHGIHYSMPKNPPITVSFQGLDSQADGTRLARFSVSNHTARAVEYMADAASQPRYSVLQYLGASTNGGNIYYNITNHNSRAAVGPMSSLNPGATVICSVRIPAGVTNELVLLHYIPRQPVAESLKQIRRATRLDLPVRQCEESYPVWEPFEVVGKR